MTPAPPNPHMPTLTEPHPIAHHSEKKLWNVISKQTLIDALNDPRIPDGASLTRTANYPGLAILAGTIPDLEYIGYIDLFDGEVVINPEPRADDGKNPYRVADGPSFYSEQWTGAV